MAQEIKAVGGLLGAVGCGVHTIIGGAATVVTLGQCEATKNYTSTFAQATGTCLSYTGDKLVHSTAVSAVHTVSASAGAIGGGVATVVTLGQVQATKDFTADMVDEMHDAVAKTGERGVGLDDGQFSVGWTRGGNKYHTYYRGGQRYDQLSVAIVLADKDDGRAADGPFVRDYFEPNGARIDLLEDQASEPPGSKMKQDILEFVSSPGNNKFLFLAGHGSSSGDACLGSRDVDKAYINIHDVLAELNRVSFTGHFTFLIDTCYAGKWITEAMRALVDGADNTDRMKEAAVCARRDISLNFRCASMSFEPSYRNTSGLWIGDVYTTAAIKAMWREERFAAASCGGYVPGWGTEFCVKTKTPADWHHASAFTAMVHERQTDSLCDFRFHHSTRRWHSYRP